MKHVRSALLGLGLVGSGLLGTKALLEGATQGGTVQAPRFEVDPMWPKPMPNHWLLGSATGIAIDSRDHVYVIHLTDSFTARTETGAGTITPAGECCSSAPNVLEFDPAGNLVSSWGGPGQGYDWPTQNAVSRSIRPATSGLVAWVAPTPACSSSRRTGSSWRNTGRRSR